MNAGDNSEDHSNDFKYDDEDSDEDDHWILKEAAEWATTSEMNSQRNCTLLKIPVESELKNAAAIKDVGRISGTKSDRKLQLSPQSYQKDCYSLHVTQISYNATEDDIRQHFVQAGCIGIQSIRMVYDFSQKNSAEASQKKKFRGVAFVDLSDEQSYEYALQKLHGSLLLSRKINVRPVKSKAELANIVQQTRTIVSEKIRTEKEKKLESDGPSDKKRKSLLHKRKKDQSSLESKAKEIPSSPSKRRRESSSSTKLPSNQSSAKASKLTKQQRNRRAAILLSKRKS